MSQLSADRRETWITGIGLVSSLGDGLEANWDALRSGRVNVDLEKYAPWMIHPLAPLNLDSQIPKKGDQRQMEAWQRIGTYAAGLALDSAGIKDNKEILARTDMIVAAGGGERDLDVDAAILTARADARSGVLNERLMNDLRPTLFLAQLSNLLAGNISIVHGVSRSSRTFNMGLDDAGTSILLPPIVAVLFLAGRGGAASFAAVLLADRCFDQSRSNGGRGFTPGATCLACP
jgi:3-oxoacyl-[acyl-carrier-protein] synthase II